MTWPHPDRVRRLTETWLETGASLVTSQAWSGPDQGSAELLADPGLPSASISLEELSQNSWTPRWLGASFAFERRVYTEFGRFDRERLPRGGDHVIPTWAALLGGVHYLAEPLLLWRKHEQQMTGQTADFGSGGDSHGETWRAFDLTALVYRYDEIVAFEERRGATAQTTAAKAELLRTLEGLARQWNEPRARLEASGFRLRFDPRRPSQVAA